MVKENLKLDKVIARCASLCAKAEHSKFEIRRKLKQWGVDYEMMNIVLARLEKDGFLDDDRFAKAYVNDKLIFDHWGRIKIRYMLRQHDIDEKTIESAMALIDEEEYMKILRGLVEDRYCILQDKEAEKRKVTLYRYVVSRGYEPYLVSDELRKLSFEEEDR